MQLKHTIKVPAGPDRVWDFVTDVSRVGPCLPGATIDTVEGETFGGRVALKVGPVRMSFAGAGEFTEKNLQEHRITMHASGEEPRGNSSAAATVTASLHPDPEGTRIDVDTDLAVTGRVAQYGRGVMTDIGAKLLDEFATRLAAELRSAPADGPSQPSSQPAASSASRNGNPHAEPELDLTAPIREAMLRRAPWVVATAAVALAAVTIARCRRRARRSIGEPAVALAGGPGRQPTVG